MAKWKCGICNKEFDNFQAQGFNGVIYCPLCYFKELYKREKSKNDKAIEYIKTHSRQEEMWFDNKRGEIHQDFILVCKTDELVKILRGNDE